MENSKGTNYRNVYKSDHLGAVDLEDLIESGKDLIFTIKHVKQELNTKVAGKRIDANIAYFVEDIKPLVLNATNARIISRFAKSTHVEKWNNITIELYIDHNVNFKGSIVDGVRVKLQQPTEKKSHLKRINKVTFDKLITALSKGTYTEEEARKIYVFSEDQEKVIDELKNTK